MSEEKIEVFFPDELIERIAQRAAEIVLEKQSQSQGDEKEFLRAKEVAEIVPCSVSKIYHLVQLRRIPFEKVGQQLCFRRSEILEWKRRGGASTPA